MDWKVGLDYVVENCEYVSKLGAALDTNNTIVKKQVFELLSALCSHNAEGYSKAIQTLDYYKKIKQERFSFKILFRELESTTAPEYQLTLISFINCVIASAPNFSDRFRIRNELIGLGVLPILKKLRRESNGIDDIITQLDVFDAQQQCDESLNLQAPEGINLNSHLDVFYAILGQVAGTPQEIQFLSILQHLLRIDSKEAISDVVWKTAEKLVHRATLLENEDDSNHLLRPPSIQKLPCQSCRTSVTSPTRKQHPSVSDLTDNTTNNTTTSSIPSQPPPPPPMLEPPPPPPMTFSVVNKNKPAETPKESRDKNNETTEMKLLPQQEIPLPNSKMKTINWNKIPSNKVLGKWNIWAIVADTHQNNNDSILDWDEMEGLFCLQSASNNQSYNLKQENNTGSLDRKMRKEISEITLLDGKRNLNVNIFLKQFKSSNEEILQLIRNGQHQEIGSEKLRGFLKILPEFDEVDLLRSFDGDKSKLGNAEKFLIELQNVPNYKLRIECMLLKEEFAANITYLEPLISSILFAGEDLINNKALREILFMVVMAGNFLNAGRYAGNAAGVKLTSLQKLADIRANKTGINLIHFVAMQAEKVNPDLLSFPSQLTNMENVSRTTIEQINNEINALDLRIRKIRDQINLESTENDIRIQMTDFLLVAERQVATLKRGMEDVEMIRMKLASFFCEDPATFKLEECFKIFHNFCERFKDAVKENERRRVLEEQARVRRKQREEQMARKMKLNFHNLAYNSDVENNSELRNVLKDHLNNSEESLNAQHDGFSPDVRPFGGSLRRPRNRVITKDDEGSLMEFLKSSGEENNTRQIRSSSYGSLDRSWARKARSGSYARMRPGLRSIDFGENRERPNSPASVVEDVNAVPEPPKPRVSREWRQKIESWLQGNKNDDKMHDGHRSRNRRLTNVSSLESNADNDRQKLDTLPEEKSASVPNDSCKRESQEWKTTNVTNISIPSPAEEDYRPIFQRRNSSRNYNRLTIHTSLDSEKSNNSSFDESPRTEHKGLILTQPLDTAVDNTLKQPINHYTDLKVSQSQNIPRSKVYGENLEISNIITKDPKILNNNAINSSEVNKCINQDTFYNNSTKERNVEMDLYQRGFEKVSGIPSPKYYNHSNDRVSVKEPKHDIKEEPLNEPTKPVSEVSKIVFEEEPVKNDYFNESEKYNTYDVKGRKDSRRISRINQEDVRKALRNLKSPTEKGEFMKGAMKSTAKDKTIKSSNPDFNDEGFEETQSFVSDTPSLGKECNTLTGENSFPNVPVDKDISKSKTIKKVLKYPSFGFSRSTLKNKPENIEKHRMTSNSNRRNVERSSSRVSLQSSVSSLTSSHSTNTVRKVVSPSNKSLPKRRISSIIPHNKSITSAKMKSSAPLCDLPPQPTTNSAKIKRDSSSSSLLGHKDSRFMKLRARENSTTKISNPRELKTDVTFVNRFMRPTASSVTKRYDSHK